MPCYGRWSGSGDERCQFYRLHGLARLLSPRNFGVFVLAILVVDVARIVSSAGLSDAVTRDKESGRASGRYRLLGQPGVCVHRRRPDRVLAPLYALVVEQPEITLVVRCLAVLVPVSSLSGIHTARKLGEFRHKAVATRVISGGALGGAARSPPPLQTSVYGVR